MAIDIKSICGYTLAYDEGLRKFIITDEDGTELASCRTQDEAEIKAKALSKREFKRIPIFKMTPQGQTTMGELTSLDRDDRSFWVSLEKGETTWGSGRQKISLTYDQGYFEATTKNTAALEAIEKKRLIIGKAHTEITDLIGTLEKPINSAYFGMRSGY